MSRVYTANREINTSNWGCKATNKTARHLVDILKEHEENYVINKINKLLSNYYQKMVGLIGIGKYQQYYMLLVRKDVLLSLQEMNVSFHKTRTHANSIVMMIHRSFIDLDYDENNENPMV